MELVLTCLHILRSATDLFVFIIWKAPIIVVIWLWWYNCWIMAVRKLRIIPRRKLKSTYSQRGAFYVQAGAEYVRHVSSLMKTGINSLLLTSSSVTSEGSGSSSENFWDLFSFRYIWCNFVVQRIFWCNFVTTIWEDIQVKDHPP